MSYIENPSPELDFNDRVGVVTQTGEYPLKMEAWGERGVRSCDMKCDLDVINYLDLLLILVTFTVYSI